MTAIEYAKLNLKNKKVIIQEYLDSDLIAKDYPYAIKWRQSLGERLLYDPMIKDLNCILNFINKEEE